MSALTTLQQPDNFEAILAKRNLAKTTRYRYGREIKLARAAGVNLLDATAVSYYAAELPSSRKMFLRAAVGLLADELSQVAKAEATPANVAEMQAVLWRAEALKESIQVQATKGQQAHTWLNLAEVRSLLTSLTDETTIKGKRDRVVLGLLVGAGVRRDELAGLTWEDVKKQGERTVLSITGKGKKRRVIPIHNKLVYLLDRWAELIGRTGYIARSVTKGSELGESISGQAILDIVDAYGQELGKEKLRPHDLRRTYARIGYDAGIDIGQISKLLGHASIATTQRYLGLQIDLKKTVSDFVPFS
ncbi:MAG: site-specific integrase [Anaerolineales bacterium]|nr:site-specific integrase [Anaerolineales bacterium]